MHMGDRDFVMQKLELLREWIESYNHLIASVEAELELLRTRKVELEEHRNGLVEELATEERVMFGSGD
jgi:hypothetical protein